jgi:hyaluronoglucosaminidase
MANRVHPTAQPILGIVEGFFGPLWSWIEREALVSTVAASGYRRYMYAPKGDFALRRAWEDDYDRGWLESLTAFAHHCEKYGVEFGVGLSPYGLQTSCTDARLTRLKAQLRALTNVGVKRFAILFDDMDAGVDELAATQLKIVDAATDAVPSGKFIVCPSYYSDDIVLDRVFGDRPANYLETLGRSLDPSIEIFWTGAEVCARQFGATHLKRVGDLLKRKPTLWDNYPVNDGPRMSNHLHLRAFTGRSAFDAPYIAAHMINPALQPALSTVPALTLADVYNDGQSYDYARSLQNALTKVAGETLSVHLREDLIALQDTRRDRLGVKRDTLFAKYSQFEHPIAKEICAWLNGVYAVSAEQVQTQ